MSAFLILFACLLIQEEPATSVQADSFEKESLPESRAEAESRQESVELRWKYVESEEIDVRYCFEIRTEAETTKQTLFLYNLRWNVASVLEDESADVTLTVKRVRLFHRSELAGLKVYDSQKKNSFQVSEAVGKEMEVFLNIVRTLEGKQFRLNFKPDGSVNSYGQTPNSLRQLTPAIFPRLPARKLQLGESFTVSQGQEKSETYRLARLQKRDDETIAVLESQDDTTRIRFLVDEGRVLDSAEWDVTRFRKKDESSYLQGVVTRYDLKRARDNPEFPIHDSLQPQDAGRAIRMAFQSLQASEKMQEDLVNERGLLSKLQNSLLVEYLPSIELTEFPTVEKPVDWLFANRFYEKTGDTEKQKQSLYLALESLASIEDRDDLNRNHFLALLTDAMIQFGDYEGARQASLAISPNASKGTQFTSQGVFQIPTAAMQGYFLLRTSSAVADAGQFDRAIEIIEQIECEPTKGAAYWLLVMKLAEQGEFEKAVHYSMLAGDRDSDVDTVFEFQRHGPSPVPAHAYRTLALGRLALQQALRNKREATERTLQLIQDDDERNAVLTDVVIALEEAGHPKLATDWTAPLPPFMASVATANRIAYRIRNDNLNELEPMIESIAEPSWKAASLINYVAALHETGTEVDLNTQIKSVISLIKEMDNPQKEITTLKNLGGLYQAIGKPEAAKAVYKSAIDLIPSYKLPITDAVAMTIEMAKPLAMLLSEEELIDLVNSTAAMINDLEIDQRDFAWSLLVETCLKGGLTQRAEEFANKIDSASYRSQALAEVGHFHGKRFEFEKSREVFASAYDNGLSVVDVGGLDTIYSKGGAIRAIAKRQGDCDLAGLIYFLEDSNHWKLKAYGYLAAAESMKPDFAVEAENTASLPEGVLMEVCTENRACRMIAGDYSISIDEDE